MKESDRGAMKEREMRRAIEEKGKERDGWKEGYGRERKKKK